MIISVSNTVAHPVSSNQKAKLGDDQLKATVVSHFEKLGLTSGEIKWNDQGHLELANPNALKLHTLMLEMEKLGLSLKMTKQTLIEIC